MRRRRPPIRDRHGLTDREYLGDGVYAAVDQFGCVLLTTEDGIEATNEIVFEPEVYAALEQWIARVRGRRKP